MVKPLIVVNLKTYQFGENALKLCKKIEKVDRDIIVGVSAVDVYRISKETKLKVFCEHVDLGEMGRNTGFVLAEAVKADGAEGVFLNHSEHRLEWKVLVRTIEKCKKVGLKVLVFVKDLAEAKKVEKLGVDYLCWEPAELVGGAISVSSARPEIIEKIRKGLKGDFLVGAGIKTHEDLVTSMRLGASGVALSSGITKSSNPKKTLKELLGK